MQYTFRQQHFVGLIQRRLDYIFIYHNFQEVVQNSEILGAISTDHSSLFCSFQHFSKLKKGSGLWKFNNSLVSNKYFIHKVREQLNSQTQFCDQTKWEILITIKFSKNLAQLRRNI